MAVSQKAEAPTTGTTGTATATATFTEVNSHYYAGSFTPSQDTKFSRATGVTVTFDAEKVDESCEGDINIDLGLNFSSTSYWGWAQYDGAHYTFTVNDVSSNSTTLGAYLYNLQMDGNGWWQLGCELNYTNMKAVVTYEHYTCASTCASGECTGPGLDQCTSCTGDNYVKSATPENPGVGTCEACGTVAETCESSSTCTTDHPRTCLACKPCTGDTGGLSGYFSACNADGTRTCNAFSDCKAGQHQVGDLVEDKDRLCGACSAGTASLNGTNDKACAACAQGMTSDYDKETAPTNPDNGQKVGPTECYWIPQAFGISPTSGVNEGGEQVTIVGAHFNTDVDEAGKPVIKVLFGGTPATVMSVKDNLITVVSPAHVAGTVDVTVDNNNDRRVRTTALKGGFRYVGPRIAVTVAAITPNSGGIAGGTKVVIAGGGFVAGETHVQFDGLPGTDVKVTAPNSLTVVTPAHAKGAVSVVVINGRGGMGTLTNGFTYTDSLPPTEADAGVTTVTGSATATGTSATVTSSATATGISATGIATATSVVATATNTGSATVTTATGTATSVVATATRTNTATSVITTSVVTGSATTVDAGTDAAADGGSDAVIKTDGGVDAPAVDTKPVVDGGVDTAADAGVLTDGSVPPVDAIVPGVDAAPIGVDAKPVVVDAAADAATVVKKSDSGCDCRMGSSNAGQNGGVILLILGSVLVAIRRKRNRR